MNTERKQGIPMPDINIRPRTLRRRLALVGLGGAIAAAALTLPPQAHADGVISPAEASYITRYHTAVCTVIDAYPNEGGVLGVMQGIVEDGWAADSAVDIINGAVSAYCPDHWPLLQRIGRNARAKVTA